MILAGLATGLLLLLAAGFGIAMLLARGALRLNLIECGVHAWFFGCGAVSVLLWLGGFFLGGLWLQGAVTMCCVALGVCGWRLARGRDFSFPKPTGAAEWLLTCIVVLELAAMFYAVSRHGLGWDGVLNWEIKARYAFLNGGTMPDTYFSSPSRVFSHPEYPLLIPMTELWLYLWMGEAHQFWVKLIFPLFYTAGILFLALAVARIAGRRWIGLAAAALLFFVPHLSTGSGGVIVGYADVPISFLYLGALACLLFFLQTGEPHFFRLYAACLMLLPWAKREGAVLWFVAALWGAVIVAQRKRLIVSLPYLLPGLFVILGWREYLDSVSAAPPIDFLAVSLAALQANAGRALPIAHEVFTEMLRFSRWSLFWPLLAFSFASLLLHGRDRRLLVLSFAVGAPIAAYAATYFFSGWLDYHAHIHSSLARLLLQVVPAGWLVIALAFENLAARGFGFQPRDP